MYPDWLTRRQQLARPRVAIVRALDERNAEGYLAWRRKWDRGFVGVDPALAGRALYDRYYENKRRFARQWLTQHAHPSAPVRQLLRRALALVK